jgi:iron-sulfur cluster repair protein YtfE (RIC family)
MGHFLRLEETFHKQFFLDNDTMKHSTIILSLKNLLLNLTIYNKKIEATHQKMHLFLKNVSKLFFSLKKNQTMHLQK